MASLHTVTGASVISEMVGSAVAMSEGAMDGAKGDVDVIKGEEGAACAGGDLSGEDLEFGDGTEKEKWICLSGAGRR